jgi:hypothetical protein
LICLWRIVRLNSLITLFGTFLGLIYIFRTIWSIFFPWSSDWFNVNLIGCIYALIILFSFVNVKDRVIFHMNNIICIQFFLQFSYINLFSIVCIFQSSLCFTELSRKLKGFRLFFLVVSNVFATSSCLELGVISPIRSHNWEMDYYSMFFESGQCLKTFLSSEDLVYDFFKKPFYLRFLESPL